MLPSRISGCLAIEDEAQRKSCFLAKDGLEARAGAGRKGMERSSGIARERCCRTELQSVFGGRKRAGESTESRKFAETQKTIQQRTDANFQNNSQLSTQFCLGDREVFQSFKWNFSTSFR